MIHRIFPLLLGLSAAAHSWAEPNDPAPARAALERFSAGLEHLDARFEQTITGPDGRVQEQAQGEVWLRRPDQLRWEYHGDFPEVIVADGTRVWVHDIGLEQVTVRPQQSFGQGSPFMLLTGLDGIDDHYRVVEAGDYDGLQLLMLQPHDSNADFDRILLGIDETGLRSMTLEDAFGLRTEIRFTDVVRNEAVADDLFRFEPPAGVDVIGLEAAGNETG